MVSIITPVYNSEKFLTSCVNSVLNQSYSNWEHILVNDCSTDESEEVIKKYCSQDSRIKYHKLKQNSGAGIARNKGIELATGRFIAFLDSDDTWDSNKLEKQVVFMLENEYSFTFTGYQQVMEDSREVLKSVKAVDVVDYQKALKNNYIGCLTVIYDTKHLGKIYMPSIRKRQDYALWLRILKKTNAYGLNEALAFYTVRKNSISSSKINLIKYQWKLFKEIEGFSVVKTMYYVILNVLNKLIKG